jgi:hemerythrin superfamily protein
METIGSNEDEILIPADDEFLGEGDDVIAFLKAQHDTIELLFEAVLEARGSDREHSFYQLRRLLAVHETAEEQIVHPAARRVLAEGTAIVSRRLDEENQAKHMLADIEALDLHSAAFEARLRELSEACSRTPRPRRARNSMTWGSSSTRTGW